MWAFYKKKFEWNLTIRWRDIKVATEKKSRQVVAKWSWRPKVATFKSRRFGHGRRFLVANKLARATLSLKGSQMESINLVTMEIFFFR